MEHVNCDLCGSSEDYSVLWDKAEREKAGVLRSVVIRDKEGNIVHGRNVMCKRCGLVYVSPRMSKEELDHFYVEDYRKTYGGGASLESEKRHARTAFQLMPGGIHLDIGCSTGQLIAMTGGCGIEPNTEYCEKAQKAGLNVTNTTIEEYNPDIRFNVITILNTLEHVLSPTAVLSKIYSLLDESGYVLISVPNLLSTHINIPVDAFLSNVHLHNFTPATLYMLLMKAGLRVVKAWPVVEEMGEKLYMLTQKGEPVQITYNDNIEKRIEFTKMFLEYEDRIFVLKNVLNNGIK